MSETEPTRPHGGGWAPRWVTALLVASAVVSIGYWSYRGLCERDTEAMESPLMLSVARQLTDGPRGLYGPYGGSNPLVLIHAPLYYRAAALLAWPMARAGLQPVAAARVAGRSLSALGLAAAMAAAYRLGRLGGLPRRSGWWAALVLAASPLLGAQPFAVRPDMVGVALQSWGLVLALESLTEGRRRLGWASVLFGLAVCAKQHLLVGWAVSAVIAAWGWMRGRLGPGAVVWVVLPGLAVAGLIYGAEWQVTGGRVWEAAFVAAAHVGRVHPGDWNKVLILVIGIVNLSAGTVCLLAASAFIAAGRRSRILRKVSIGVGSLAIGIVLGAEIVHVNYGSAKTGTATFLATGLAAAAALPAAAFCARGSATAKGFDAILWGCLAAEVALVLILSWTSAGAWVNYGISATILVTALAGRTLSRALVGRVPPLWGLPMALAPVVVMAACVQSVTEARWFAHVDDILDRLIHDELHRPRASYFFASRPGFNRINGRIELVYDDWLYPVFESLGLAEPRSRWLVRALATGPVRVVVNPSERPFVEGTTTDLRRLGYRPQIKLEPYYYIWVR